MHTIQVGTLYAHHNSDWSGEVYVGVDGAGGQPGMVTYDGAEFLKLCTRAVVRAIEAGSLSVPDIEALDEVLGHGY